MSGLVLGGAPEGVPGLVVGSWLDDARLRITAPDAVPRRDRRRWIRAIVLHTTKGISPQRVAPGRGPNTSVAQRIARLWTLDPKATGAHISVDWDGSVCCHADILEEATMHAGPTAPGSVNQISVGVEIYQNGKGLLYAAQIEAVVTLLDWLTARLGVQRQMPRVSDDGVLMRCSRGGDDVVGIYGHRHVTDRRGPGDPGDAVFEALVAAGYETFDLNMRDDRRCWAERQRALKIKQPDGIPGPRTRQLLRAGGKPVGLWVSRPVDSQVSVVI